MGFHEDRFFSDVQNHKGKNRVFPPCRNVITLREFYGLLF